MKMKYLKKKKDKKDEKTQEKVAVRRKGRKKKK